MVSITPHNLHWLSVEAPQTDLCVHGGVVLSRGNHILVDQRSENWTLSAAALMLLRTLTEDHTADHRVGEHLFPCCAHAMYEQAGSEDVLIVGCSNGLDWEVAHRDGQVELGLEDQPAITVPASEWSTAVLAFSDAVSAFYAVSAPKEPSDPDGAKGFRVFCAEWKRRYDAARRAA